MINNHKLAGFLERVNGSKRPITADIFLTDFCNEKCAYCRFSHKTGNYISFENFVIYTNRLLELGVQSFILTGGGEPSVNPDFKKIADWLEANNIPYGVNTNLVKMHFIKPVFLKVSIDAGSKDKYCRTRGVDYFDKVLSNLYDYLQFKNGSGASTTVGVQCVALNEQDIKEFYEAIKGFDVDYIYFRPFENKFGRHTPSELITCIDNLAAQDPRVTKSFKFTLEDFRVPYCIGNWASITVDCNGNVPYCCARPTELVGNILDSDILEKLKSYKVDTKDCEIPCRLSGANHFLANYKKENDYCFI